MAVTCSSSQTHHSADEEERPCTPHSGSSCIDSDSSLREFGSSSSVEDDAAQAVQHGIQDCMYEEDLAEMFANYIPGQGPTEEELDMLFYDEDITKPGLESSRYLLIVSRILTLCQARHIADVAYSAR